MILVRLNGALGPWIAHLTVYKVRIMCYHPKHPAIFLMNQQYMELCAKIEGEVQVKSLIEDVEKI